MGRSLQSSAEPDGADGTSSLLTLAVRPIAGRPVPMIGPESDLYALVEAMPLPALLLEADTLRLVAGNVEALAALDLPPTASRHALAAAWAGILAAPSQGPELARWLAGGTDAFTVRLRGPAVQPGAPLRIFDLRHRRIRVGDQALLSLALAERPQRDALSVAQTRLEVALAGADLGAWHWDTRTNRLEVTPRWATMLGLAPPAAPLRVTEWASLLHPADRSRVRALLDRHLREDLGTYETEFRIRHADGHWVPILARGQVLERDANGQALVMTGTHFDLSTIRQAEAALRASERQARHRLATLEQLYRSAPLGLGQLDSELRFVRINQALAEINGLTVEAHIGRGVFELVPDLRDAAEPLLRRVLDRGETITGIQFTGVTAKAPGVTRDWEERFYPLRDPDSRQVTGIGIVCEEVTERRRFERTRDLLVRELDHRVKNLFAVIGGLVVFTARQAPSPEAMRDTLRGRIDALARAHDLLRPAMARRDGAAAAAGAGMATGGSLAALLSTLLAPFRSGAGSEQAERLRIAGSEVPLGLVAAPPLALAMHELATNAAKYGALASPAGEVAITWRLEGPLLRLDWCETGGPPVQGPPVLASNGRGFGHRLVAQSAAQLGGRAEFAWEPGGLCVTLWLPLDRLAQTATA